MLATTEFNSSGFRATRGALKVMSAHVEIVEVGPRDGLQIARGIMPNDTKIAWIEALVDAGFRSVEIGSFVPPKLVPQMADTAEILRRIKISRPRLEAAVLVPNLRGAQMACDSGADVIVLPVSVSESHSRANTNKATMEQVAEAGRIANYLAGRTTPPRFETGCSTAFGCSIEGAVPVSRVCDVAHALVENGSDMIVLADTLGYATPLQVREVVTAVRVAVGDKLRKLHLHDTTGTGLANAVAGFEAGIRAFDTALAGLGGCPFAPGAAGNIVTEDLVYLFETMGIETGLDLRALIDARSFISLGLPEEPLRGALGLAGIPPTYRKARRA